MVELPLRSEPEASIGRRRRSGEGERNSGGHSIFLGLSHRPSDRAATSPIRHPRRVAADLSPMELERIRLTPADELYLTEDTAQIVVRTAANTPS